MKNDQMEEMSEVIILTVRLTRNWIIKSNKTLFEKLLFDGCNENTDNTKENKLNFLKANLKPEESTRRFFKCKVRVKSLLTNILESTVSKEMT